VITPGSDVQAAFLACDADFALYGGAAGGGKTFGLLLDPLHFVHIPGFRGALFRMVFSDHFGPGGLFDEAQGLWGQSDAVSFRQTPSMDATFPSGAMIQFRYPDMRRWRKQVQGLQIAWAGFDELTHFPMEYVLAVHGRLRSGTGIRPSIRATCNPDPDHPIRQWVDPYLDSDGYADRRHSGEIRWFAADSEGDHLVWGATREEAARAAGRPVEYAFSFAFFPARAADNAPLMAHEPNYAARHSTGGRANEERLDLGNWNVRDEAAGMLRRSRWLHVEPGDVPRLIRRVWAWDKAATKPSAKSPNPDFTAGVAWGQDEQGRHWLFDAVAARDEPPEIDALTRTTGIAAGPGVAHHFPVDPAQAGRVDREHIRRVMRSPRIGQLHFSTPTKSKELRAQPLARALREGRVHVVMGDWYDRAYVDRGVRTTMGNLLWQHVDGFPHVKEPGRPLPKDDLADACADGFNFCEGRSAGLGGSPDTWKKIAAGLTRRAGAWQG
jgi:phage terminase large subunit-like protein